MRPTKKTKRARLGSQALGVATNALGAAVRNLENARRIANFLRGRMELQTRPTDIYISSYPRSGTTLTQWILYLLTHDEQPDPDHLTKVSPWFERSLAIGELTADDLASFDSPRVFKSHLPREWLPDGARYIYVEREVEDVLVSYFHFYQAYLGFRGSLEDFYRRFVDGRVQYGSWFEHVASWHEHADDPDVLILRYEELLADRGHESGMGIADDESDTAETALDERTDEAGPGTTLAVARGEVEPEHAALTGHRHPDGHERGHVHHPARLAHLHVGRVEPEVGIGLARERAGTEGLDLGIERGADAADLALADVRDAECFDEILDPSGADTEHVGLLHHCEQGPLGPPAGLDERG